MCGICRTVNCIRRRLFGCCNSCSNNYGNDCDSYGYRDCDDRCSYKYNNGCSSRYTEPDTNVICANQRDNGFTPCCDDDDCRCNKHHHHNDCCCD